MSEAAPFRGGHGREAPSALLTIAVPTCNRAPKLSRLLACLEHDLTEAGLLDQVLVFVASNASTDATLDVLCAATAHLRLSYVQHPQNIGYDANVLFLYSNATTPYLWLFGDDDMPSKGAIATLYA